MGAEGQAHPGRRRRYEPPVIWLWLAGRDLDEERGQGRTDATWWHDYTRVLHPIPGGHATRWAKMAHWKRSAIRQALLVMVPVTGWDYWHHPAVTILGLSELFAIYAGYYGWRGTRRFFPLPHYWQYVRPLTHTLQAELGFVPTYLQIEPDRSKVVIGLPPEYLGSDHERGAITKAIQEKVGMIEPAPSWNLKGRNHEATFTQSEPPPLDVYPRHVIPAIQRAKEHELVYGCVKGGDVLKRSLDQDSPHVCLCIESGGGKSTVCRNLACQHLHHGGIVIILDTKMTSHMWADDEDVRAAEGPMPNVVYAYTPAMVHQVLMWLANDEDQESELTYRKRIGRRHITIDGKMETDIGPRILIIAEEQNATQGALKRYWKSIGGKGTPPSCVAQDEISATGREFKMHIVYVAQRATAKATSGTGSADSQENIGTWVFGNPKDRTWNLLGEGYAKPPPTDHKGRYHMMDNGGLTCFQGVFWTPREARDFATSGKRAEPHRDLPFTRHVAVPGHVMINGHEGPEQAIVQDIAPRPPMTATLREAIAAGVFNGADVQAVRKRVQRAGIEDMGYEGNSKLYRIADLQELAR